MLVAPGGMKTTITRIARRLGLGWLVSEPPPTGLVAAIVCIDWSSEDGTPLSEDQEQQIVAGLSEAVEATAGGQFDGAERNSSQVLWYFFGSSSSDLERALLPVLRRERRCAGGLVRLTDNGVVGPWREVRI